MIEVTLTDYAPVPRYDGVPWTTARIEEAATEDGEWATIDTITLDPVDQDPENPLTRNFTTDNATINAGWYRIVWLDDAQHESVTPPVHNVRVDRAYRPLVSDVADVLRAHTTDVNSNQLGTFTATTNPTYEQATRVIDSAMQKLEARFGPAVAAELVGSARDVVKFRSAMLIELSYFGSQMRADRSVYKELKDLYTEALSDFILERKQLGADETPGTADDLSAAGLPAYSFPSGPDISGACW